MYKSNRILEDEKKMNPKENFPEPIQSSKFVLHKIRKSGEFVSREDSQNQNEDLHSWYSQVLEMSGIELSGLHIFIIWPFHND